jgi:hypothetical protein
MPDLSMFLPITKVDAARRLVYGVATAEVADRAGEICDYASTKPNYEQWSQEISRSTNGKSFGNLRAMHGPIAAGKVTAITFNDEAKQIEICAKVVDDTEWLKVTEGVYSGFSQGGTYAQRWTDEDGLTRYTAVPTEISLVDLPCLPQAHFEMIKADGSKEWRRFGHKSDVAQRIGLLVEEMDWLQDADISPEEGSAPGPEEAEELRDLLERASTILRGLMSLPIEGAPRRGMNVRAPARRRTSHDVSAKAGRGDEDKHDDSRIQRMHDTAVELGAACGAQKRAGGGLEKRFDRIAVTLADVLARIKKIEEQPLPLPYIGPTRAVSKQRDLGLDPGHGDSVEALLSDPDALSVLAIKLAQRNGRGSNR